MATDNPKISVDFLKQNYPGLSEELEDEDLQSIVQQLGNAMIKTKGALQLVSREALQILVEKKDFPVFALDALKPPKGTDSRTQARAEVALLSKEVNQLKYAMQGRDSRTTSYPEYFIEKSREGRVLQWTLPSVVNPILPSYLRPSAGPPKGGELSTVKPFWKGLIENYPQALFQGYSVAYEVGYVGPKIPDIAIFPTNVEKPTAGEFVAYGDCIGSKWSGYSASELGQAMTYGHRILEAQPLRTHVYGFFTNNDIVVLIKTSRTGFGRGPYPIQWHISAPMTFDQGMATFYQFLKDDVGFMLPTTVNQIIVDIVEPLAPGGTCRAFRSNYNGEEVVAKLFYNELQVADNVSKLNHANKALAKAAAVARQGGQGLPFAQIPTVRGSAGRWLLTTPYGRPFSSLDLTMDHVRALVGTLQAVHTAKMVHRDVRFANIFLLHDDSVLLSDWGSLADAGALQAVAGCPEPWNHPELRRVEEFAPHPKHDLYSLVQSIAALTSPGVIPETRTENFKLAIDAANNCDYMGVVAEMAKQIVDPMAMQM